MYVGILTDIKPIFMVFSVPSAEYQRFTLQAVEGLALLSDTHYVHKLTSTNHANRCLSSVLVLISTGMEVHSNMRNETQRKQQLC